jgi:hypothetical protein
VSSQLRVQRHRSGPCQQPLRDFGVVADPCTQMPDLRAEGPAPLRAEDPEAFHGPDPDDVPAGVGAAERTTKRPADAEGWDVRACDGALARRDCLPARRCHAGTGSCCWHGGWRGTPRCRLPAPTAPMGRRWRAQPAWSPSPPERWHRRGCSAPAPAAVVGEGRVEKHCEGLLEPAPSARWRAAGTCRADARASEQVRRRHLDLLEEIDAQQVTCSNPGFKGTIPGAGSSTPGTCYGNAYSRAARCRGPTSPYPRSAASSRAPLRRVMESLAAAPHEPYVVYVG